MAKCIDFKTPEKTYATRENLAKAPLKYEFLNDAGYLTATTEEGRFYPVFVMSRLPAGVNPGLLPHLGFCIIN